MPGVEMGRTGRMGEVLDLEGIRQSLGPWSWQWEGRDFKRKRELRDCASGQGGTRGTEPPSPLSSETWRTGLSGGPCHWPITVVGAVTHRQVGCGHWAAQVLSQNQYYPVGSDHLTGVTNAPS